MRLSVLMSSLAVMGLFLSGSVLAESNVAGDDYRLPLYDKLEFEAEASGNKVYMNWSAFEGHNDEEFEYYKVIRSQGNPNPLYPEDGAIGVKSSLGDTRHTDGNAWKSAYYRVCAITNVKGRHCSKVIWVEIEKTEAKKEQHDCKNWSSTGECEMTYDEWAAEKEAQKKEWEAKQDEAKARLEAKKAEAKKEWEQKQAENKEKWAAKKEETKEDWAQKKSDAQDERWNKLYAKLDAWLAKFGERLKNSNLTNVQKVEKIEQIQTRFYAWEKDNELRMKMVDHLDESLNAWKAEYSSNSDFDEIDSFLEGLLD